MLRVTVKQNDSGKRFVAISVLSPQNAAPLVSPGLYRHFKGGLYLVLTVARHSETQEAVVVYRAYEGAEIWVRPYSMFTESVLSNGSVVPRFERALELQYEQKPERAFA